MPVILVTDVLVWLLVAAVTGYALYCRRHPHLAVPWAKVFRSAAAMASIVVLGVYVALGLLDSLHFRPALERNAGEQKAGEKAAYSSEVLSVLDLALSHLRGTARKPIPHPLRPVHMPRSRSNCPTGARCAIFHGCASAART